MLWDYKLVAEHIWKDGSQKVIILYAKLIYYPNGILSRAGPVKSCLKLPAPSGKAKYS